MQLISLCCESRQTGSDRMKKLAHYIACFLVLLGVLNACATTETLGGRTWTYTVNTNTLLGKEATITKVTPNAGKVIIPSLLGGCSVTCIADNAFEGCEGLLHVEIPLSVTSIGQFAFSKCRGLTSVTIPTSVTNIGYGALYYCSKIETIVLPFVGSMRGNKRTPSSVFGYIFGRYGEDGMVVYQRYAPENGGTVRYCIPKSLKSVTITDETEIEYAFNECQGIESVTLPTGLAKIGDYAFMGCRGLSAVTIPESVTGIGVDAFWCCENLKNVTIPANVMDIDVGAFYKSGLAHVTIPPKVTSISRLAFSGCGGLESVTIPSSVTNICNKAFEDCSGLTEITIPLGVTSIGDDAFYGCSGLESVTLPSSVTNIGSYAFSSCGLGSLSIPSSVTSIGSYAFSYCGGLISATIKSRVPSIKEGWFSGCSRLTSVTMPSSVTSVGYKAFDHCSGLTSVTIPSSVTSIGSSAFYYCTGLTSVAIPSSVTSIGSDAFYACRSLTSVDCAWGDVNRVKNMLRGSGVSVDNLIFKERPPLPIFTPSTGTIFNESLKISITCAVENATIHYTMDGTEPTADSPVCKKFMLSEKAEIKAVTEYDGRVSEVATAIYAKGKCEPPEISSSDQEFHFSGKDVIITCASEGAEIRYTTDGSDPTTQSRLYEGPFTIDDTTTVRAIAVGHSDYFDSEIATATFTRDWLTVANPTCNPPDGTTFYLSGQNVALSCEEGASIFYTLNGDLPTRECARYEEPLRLNDTTTIRMVAVRDDYKDSDVVTVKLTRDYYKVTAPTLSVNGSVSFTGSKFIITVSREMTSGAVLRYTLDGSDPTEESPILAGDSIVVTDTTTVKVRAFIEDWKPSDVRVVRVTKVRTLGDALNQPDVAFETSAAYPWVADRNVTHDGEESAHSGATPHNGCSWLQTAVDQATWVKFLWKVSCEKDWDGFSFLTNGIPVAKIDGEVDWTNLALYVPAGTVLRWEYKKDETTSEGSDRGWVDEITLLTDAPTIEGDEGATVTGDAETGFVIKPSDGKTAVEVTIPQGVDAAKVTVEVPPKVVSVKPNGAKVKVVVGDSDITGFLVIPESEGALNVANATVKEEIVKEALDPSKDAVIELNAANPRLTTAPTHKGLTYTLYEGRKLESLSKGDSKLGDGNQWTPTITVSGGDAAFYSIGVSK